MKLNKEIKDRIDKYFDNISAEKLFEISIREYGFSEITLELSNIKFDSTIKSFYHQKENTVFDNNIEKGEDICKLSTAA